MKRNLLIAAMVIGAGILGCLVGSYRYRETTQTTQVDTLIVHDTIMVDRPIIKEDKVIEMMYVAVRDTIVKNDTAYIALPRESKTYGDERYTAVVSGYKPSLDRLDIYVENQTVTKYLIPEKPKEKKNYLSAGIKAAYVDNISLPIYLKYERMLHKNVEIYGEVLYEIPKSSYGVAIGIEAQIGW